MLTLHIHKSPGMSPCASLSPPSPGILPPPLTRNMDHSTGKLNWNKNFGLEQDFLGGFTSCHPFFFLLLVKQKREKPSLSQKAEFRKKLLVFWTRWVPFGSLARHLEFISQTQICYNAPYK